MKKLSVLFVSLVLAANGLAQTPTPGTSQQPVQVAQAGSTAGGAAQGAAPAAAAGSTTATIVAVVAVGASAVAALAMNSSTQAATPSNH